MLSHHPAACPCLPPRSYVAVPDNQGLGRRLGEDFKRILPLIKALGHAEVRAFLETGAVEVGGVTLRGSDLQVGVGWEQSGGAGAALRTCVPPPLPLLLLLLLLLPACAPPPATR